MQSKIAKAIDLLMSECTQNVSVQMSGGKDSIVIEHLAMVSGIKYEIHSALTGIDMPEVTMFIRKEYPSTTFFRNHLSFWHLLTTHNPPAGTGRGIKWCCTKIKENPLSTGGTKIIGVRSEESTARKNRKIVSIRNGEKHIYPIYDWLEWEVWEYINSNNLKYPRIYDLGFNRTGCVICPNHQGHHEMYRAMWPNHFKLFEKKVAEWFLKRQNQGRIMWHETCQKFLDDWYIGRFYYYKQPEIGQDATRR